MALLGRFGATGIELTHRFGIARAELRELGV
jgi:hypothetical protein